MIEVRSVMFVNMADPEFNPQVESEILVINGELAFDFQGNSWLIRTVTDIREGVPVVDLAKCRRVEIITKANIMDLPEIMELKFAEALKRLAKGETE